MSNDQSARALAQSSTIKRPVIEWPDGSTSVGFDRTAWQARTAAGALTNSK